jgi:UDP-N-acetylglucosamine--N-acetylmuramyl-(pentapeptide) pyrophosphoryl-undecaprenol N-acetylglucosamine transferase
VNVVIAAGGTGGHIFPALSLADTLVRDHAAQVRFIGSRDGQEATRIPAAGYRFDAVPAAPFVREISMRAAKAPLIVARSVFACASLVRGADVAVGLGGYVSVAPLLAARRAHVPIVLHNPDAVLGLANRLLARSAAAIAIAFDDARGRIRGDARVETIGYPVRQAILDVADHRGELVAEAAAVLGIDPARRTVLVTGGSQGALHLDQVVAAALPVFAGRADLQLLVLTGPGREAELTGAAERAGAARVVVLPFLDRMELGYAAADLVVSRAGATTLAELAVCGLPSVLVPYPHATENHQDANARELARIGAAMVVPDAELTPSVFVRSVVELMDDPGRLASMGARARGWAKPDAADRFASLVVEAAKTWP